MAYSRTNDQVPADDQYAHAVDLHPAAGTILWFGYPYCSGAESDGLVPARQIRRWIMDDAAREGAIAALLETGLMEQVDDATYRLTRYLEDNMTAAQWAAHRDNAAQRKRRSRASSNRGDDPPPPADGDGDAQPDPQGPDGPPPDVTGGVTRDTPVTESGTDAGQDAGPLTQTQNPKGDGRGGERAGADEHGEPPAAITPLTWPAATTALAYAGINPVAIDRDRAELVAELHGEHRQIDWPALGRRLAAKRTNGQCAATPDEPGRALRFALGGSCAVLLGQRQRHRPGQRQPVAEGPPPYARDVSGSVGEAGWQSILDDARQHIGSDAWDTWLSVTRPIAVTGTELWIAVPDHARSWISHRLLPLLSASATRILDRPMTVRIAADASAAVSA